MAISKWLEDPIMTAIIPSLYLSPAYRVISKFKPTIMKKPSNSGIETNSISSGCCISTCPFSEKRTTSVASRAATAMLPIVGLNLFWNHASPFLVFRVLFEMMPKIMGMPMNTSTDVRSAKRSICMFRTPVRSVTMGA